MRDESTLSISSFETRQPSPLGILRKNRGLILLIVISSAVITSLLLTTNGDWFLAIALLALAAVVILTWYRIDFGYYFLLGCVLFFDQYAIPELDSHSATSRYFLNLKEFPHMEGFGPGVMNPLELHLFLLLAVWAFLLVTRNKIEFRRVPVWGAVALFFTALIAAFARGMASGGDLLPALWEIRALFYFGILYFFTPQVIRTRNQLHIVSWICIFMISFKAIQGMTRYIQLGLDFHGLDTLTNHEDALFFLSLFIMLFGLWFWKNNILQRRVLTLLLPFLLLGFYVAQRRADYAAIVPTAVMILLLLTPKEQWKFLKVAVPFFLVVAIYCAVFWNSDSAWGSPVRLVKSGISLEKETAGERYFSNLYRENEKYDLAVTVQHAPVLGIGFGKKYEMPIPLFKIPFTLRDYISHCAILWLFVKMGAAGFFFFCFLLDVFMLRSAWIFARLKDPYLRAICLVIITLLINQIVVSYYDLQLTYYRNMVFLGAIVGLLPVIEQLHLETPESRAQQDETVSARGRWHFAIQQIRVPVLHRSKRVA